MSHPSTIVNSPKHVGIIGTGPISLLKAILLSKQKPEIKITFFDSAQQIGGAWYSDKSPLGYEIECGCHIWSYSPIAYRFIEKELGVKLINMSPSPIFVGKNLHLPYSLKNTIDTYKTTFKLLFTARFGQLKIATKRPSMQFKIFGKKNKYPKTGSPELFNALYHLLQQNSNINFRLNTRIDSIEIKDNVKIKITDEQIELDHLIVTYVSGMNSLVIYDKPIEIKPRHVDYVHFLISLDKPLLKKLTYWRYMNDEIVHRITDISYQTEMKENLILVGIKGDAFHKKEESTLYKHVIDLLLRDKLINNSFQHQLIKTHVFPTYYLNAEAVNALKACQKQITSLHTTDLMYGFHYLLTEETPHLIQTPK